MHRVAAVALAGLLLGGCTATNVSELLKSIGQDTATVCITVTSVYGPVKGYRTNAMNATVKCDQEGLSVTAAPPAGAVFISPSSQFPAITVPVTK